MTGQAADPFPVDALPDNQAGRLADRQRRGFAAYDRGWRRNELSLALVFVVVGAVLLVAQGPSSSSLGRLAVGLGALLAAAFLLWRSTPGGDPISQDLRNGRVESVEGAIGRRQQSGRTTTAYYFDVGGRTFEVGRITYHAAPEAGIVRLFFLPRSHKVVNLERLPDRPLPPGTLESPVGVVAAVGADLRSHDRSQRAEAMATLAAVKDAMEEENTRRATPPPMAQRDPRPLAEAILGTWEAGFTTLTFSGDGSATMSMGGRAQAGHWSVDHDGRLHADAMGHNEAADAWIVADTLTISTGGTALSFRRVAAV